MKTITKITLAAIIAASLATPTLARRGADDPAGNVRQEDRATSRADDSAQRAATAADKAASAQRKAADDPAGHVRQGRGADDPQPHG